MRIYQLASLLSLLYLLLLPPPVLPAPTPSIKLAGYRFDPLVSVPALSKAERKSTTALTGPGYYILQFDGPVREEWKESCRQMGVEFLDYIPDFAFIVRMEASRRKQVSGLPHLRWLGEYRPAYRMPRG